MSGKKEKTSINLVGNGSTSRKKKVAKKSRRSNKARVKSTYRKSARTRRNPR